MEFKFNHDADALEESIGVTTELLNGFAAKAQKFEDSVMEKVMEGGEENPVRKSVVLELMTDHFTKSELCLLAEVIIGNNIMARIQTLITESANSVEKPS
jgi:hypothetical protein